MESPTQLLQALDAFVPGYVRLAEKDDEIAGVQPRFVVEPTSEEEVAKVLAFADGEGLRVLVRGGGTQLGLGFPPTGGDIVLSTARLNRLIEHVPHDMTVTAEAGLALVDLQAILGQAGQRLALDPMSGTTIGGVIAANASGAHRLRYGGVRDQIIGVRVVLADGTVAKGGGKVVKNVAGYDLPKLFTGSLGTLGVIVSATFRIYPLPAASRTVVLSTEESAWLFDLARRTLDSTLVPTILDILGSSNHKKILTMAVRFEMEEEAAEAQVAMLVKLAANVSAGLAQTVQVLRGEAEEDFWSHADRQVTVEDGRETTLLIKVSVLPTEMAHWLSILQHTAQHAHFSASWRAHAGHGLIFARLVGDDEALLILAIETLRQSAQQILGSLVVLDGPVGLIRQLDVWGTVPALDVMRRLKSRFDPHTTLNPGRFVGKI